MLLSKTFANNKSTTYTYNPTGTLKSGTWARGITTSYTYDNFKQLLKTSYSDNTPVITNTYFANGALKTVADNVGTTTFAYNQYGDKIKESVSGSYIKRVLSRNLDHFGREINYFIGNLKKAEYSYDESDGRFKIMNAVNGGNFEFGYMENTNLQNRIIYPNGMVKNTSFEEKRNLITGINYQNGANLISNYSYENDVLGRRTNIGTTYDNATKSNDYNYNPRSEVIGAHGDTLNQTFDYDNIGNRITSSNNDITTNYSTNNLNQYETVGDFVPLFDDDGNQTKIKTGKSEFLVEYNGENRPIKFTNLSDSTFITMKYDYMGRRGGKLHFNSQGQWQSTAKFFYKDYTLIEESSASNDVLKEFVWDPTAGSATRPLFLRLPGQAVSLLYCHDANKNVTEVSYLATANGIGAHYEYDSFGNVITSSSNTRVTTVDLRTYNPFRFSSEYHDDELCLIYYNYRHYNPQTGRWISRDPIAEEGGYNLYGMCKNNLINSIDKDGLWSFSFSFTFSAFAISGPTVSIGITFSYSKEKGFSIGNYESFSGGMTTDVGTAATFDISLNTEAKHILENEGSYVYLGGSGGKGIVLGGGTSIPNVGDCGQGSVTYVASVGLGASLTPLFVSGTAQTGITIVHEWWNIGGKKNSKITTLEISAPVTITSRGE